MVWRGDHVAEPADLDDDAAAGYWCDVVAAGRAIQAAFAPMKLNYFTLGNTMPHLHTHVVPRYEWDASPGGPIAWPDIFVDQPVADVELRAHARLLRPHLPG